MKKENKSKLKTGTVGKLSPCTKHPELILTLRLKDEPNVEEEEGVQEEEKNTKEHKKKNTMGQRSRLQQQLEPEEAVQERIILTCSKDTKTLENMAQPGGTE